MHICLEVKGQYLIFFSILRNLGKQSLSQDLTVADCLDWLAGGSRLLLISTQTLGTCHDAWLYVDPGELNSGLRTFLANTLLPEPFPQPPVVAFW